MRSFIIGAFAAAGLGLFATTASAAPFSSKTFTAPENLVEQAQSGRYCARLRRACEFKNERGEAWRRKLPQISPGMRSRLSLVSSTATRPQRRARSRALPFHLRERLILSVTPTAPTTAPHTAASPTSLRSSSQTASYTPGPVPPRTTTTSRR